MNDDYKTPEERRKFVNKFVGSFNFLSGVVSGMLGIESLVEALTNPIPLAGGTGVVALGMGRDIKESLDYSRIAYGSYLGGEFITEVIRYLSKVS